MVAESPMRERLNALSKEEEKFKSALGEFIMTWTDTENELYKTLLHYAGVRDAIGRALFSGTRARTMIDFIRAISHNADFGIPRTTDLEFVFEQMVAINTVRDRLTHFASSNLLEWEEPSTRIITNASRVSRYNKHFVEKLGSATLQEMTFDLQGIQNHLQRHWSPYTKTFTPWQENAGEPTVWRYKSSQPSTKSQRTPRAPSSQKRPRKPPST